MKLYEFSNGDTIHKYKKSIVILFKGQRNVLSTGPNNGGFTTDLSAVFNNDANPGSGMRIKLRADTYREHMDILAEEDLGLDSSACSGLLTAASMENAAISTLSYEDFSVTAITTAGVRSNGGRIGDPASWHEKSESSFDDTTPTGTINILLYINADLKKRSDGFCSRLLCRSEGCCYAGAFNFQPIFLWNCYRNRYRWCHHYSECRIKHSSYECRKAQ